MSARVHAAATGSGGDAPCLHSGKRHSSSTGTPTVINKHKDTAKSVERVSGPRGTRRCQQRRVDLLCSWASGGAAHHHMLRLRHIRWWGLGSRVAVGACPSFCALNMSLGGGNGSRWSEYQIKHIVSCEASSYFRVLLLISTAGCCRPSSHLNHVIRVIKVR